MTPKGQLNYGSLHGVPGKTHQEIEHATDFLSHPNHYLSDSLRNIGIIAAVCITEVLRGLALSPSQRESGVDSEFTSGKQSKKEII